MERGAETGVGRTRRLAELVDLIARHARPDQTTRIDGVLASAETRVGEPTPSRSGTVMALIAQGAKRIALGDRTYEYRQGQYLVASVDLPITGHYVEASAETPALGFGLVIRPAVVATLLLEERPSQRPAVSALGVADASEAMIDAAVRMLTLIERPADREVLAPMIEREILWYLLNGPMGPAMRQIAMTDSGLTQISRAVRWITDNYDQPLRVQELAGMCGMSVSSFHRNFLAVTAFSPLQFQKQVRLQQSRLLLLSGAGDVATTGFRVGYDSASQFSREYRRHFGLPPGRDAARLRAQTDS
ncbi:AraC family transcriptional regulator [Kribbella capetownensis]|uniref:AraC family transcriptional regulator n=1 Tax=Kribbella capetownensis TaxID=1572659 RepID=A0A4R0JDW9_9ACTN|nr:AraC family transcriptional regulator [Kribbella capetownensis]TCC44257.1 AraC family transcriptional regulator [Kribbella capetownensis]